MRKILFIISALFISSGFVFGQSVQFLNITPDARTISMGNTSVAMSANAFAIYNNTAATIFRKGGAIAASYTMWQPKSSKNNLINLSGYSRVGEKIALAAGFRYFNYPSQEIINGEGISAGSFSPKEYSISFGGAYLIAPSLSAAVNINYTSSSIGKESEGSAVSGDISLMYKINKISLGLSANNIGSKVDYGYSKYNLPMRIRVGAGISELLANDEHNIAANIEAGYLVEESSVFAGIGAEYNYNKMLFFRLGGYYGDKQKAMPPFASIGVGFNIKGVVLNGAYLLAGSDSPLKNTISISLGYEF
jgi:hypothetical protein